MFSRTARLRQLDPIHDAARRERGIASARAFLATTGLVAIYLDPTEPDRFAAMTYGLLSVYALYALVVLLVARARPLGTATAWILHGIDVASATVLTLLTAGPNSPFYLFFLFTILTAALRWGLRETVATSGAIIAILLLESLFMSRGDPALDLNRMIVRGAYLLIMTLLLGYLAGQEKQWRSELVAIASVMRRPNVAAGMRGTLRAVGAELAQLFDARAVLFVARDQETSHVYVWDIRPGSPLGEVTVRQHEPPAAVTYFFDAPALYRWSAVAGTYALTDDAVKVRPDARSVPAALLTAHPCSTLMAVSFGLAQVGEGRIFLLDPSTSSAWALRFLATLVEHVGPAVHNVYLLRRLRARAGAAERARVARELHDGAIQALIGLELEVQALRQRVGQQAGIDTDLEYIQTLVRGQVLELRELMQHLRPLDLESTDRLPDLLASMVEKFRRDTGISARFVSAHERTMIQPRTAVEIARIVQEALVNVRRHSRAHNVLVTLRGEAGHWTLTIDDDGRGFDFTGRLSDRQLDERRLGPTVIRERVRAIGAEIAIDSRPGAGARLEICSTPTVHA